jgi:hypothetical protein
MTEDDRPRTYFRIDCPYCECYRYRDRLERQYLCAWCHLSITLDQALVRVVLRDQAVVQYVENI